MFAIITKWNFDRGECRRGIGGASKKDFINKLQIAYKEARETKYWLRLLQAASLLEEKLADSFLKDCDEVLKILTAIINSSKRIATP